MDTIKRTISFGQQSVDYAETLSAGGTALRIGIKSDFYLQQCHARLEAYSRTDLRWNALCSIPAGAMSTRHGLKSTQRLDPDDFADDRRRLLEEGATILGIAPMPGAAPKGTSHKRAPRRGAAAAVA